MEKPVENCYPRTWTMRDLFEVLDSSIPGQVEIHLNLSPDCIRMYMDFQGGKTDVRTLFLYV